MDRFIFICFCQSCGLLPQNIYNQVMNVAKNSFDSEPYRLWKEIKGLFRSIDKGNPTKNINKYNGGLFKQDESLDCLLIEDSVLESFSELSKYDFNSDLNVNILGHIFEQSISDIEQIKGEMSGNAAHNKQKEDGIFYTPYYVTKYIVDNTLKTYLEERKEELKRSLFNNGSLFFKVVRKSTRKYNTIELKTWMEIPAETPDMTEEEYMHREAIKQLHLEYWSAYEDILKDIKICDPACGSGAFLNQCFDYLYEEMNYVLDIKQILKCGQASVYDINKKILQNNLFGVDINPESVEITKLSLWLKTAQNNQSLTSLDNNIKCGNSIIKDKDIAGELAFDWENEFKDVFDKGGFDIIIGNPPYGASIDKLQKLYIKENYSTVEGYFDTYRIFFELGLKILKNNGYLGFITPNTYFNIASGAKLRRYLFQYNLKQIVELYNVFLNAEVEPVISIYQKKYNPNDDLNIFLIPRGTKLTSGFISYGKKMVKKQVDLRNDKDYIFNYKLNDDDEYIMQSIKNISSALVEYCFVYNGAKPYEVGKGTPQQTKEMMQNHIYNGTTKIDETWIPYMRGRTIWRFTDMWDGEYIKYGENLAAPRDKEIFFREKIFIRQTGDEIVATLDNGNVCNNTLHIIFTRNDNELSNYYVLGLLNSSLMTWIYQHEHSQEVRKGQAEIKKTFVENLPLVIGTKSEIEQVAIIVKQLLKMCQKKFEIKQDFIKYIKKTYEPLKFSTKLERFEELSFKEYITELKRNKVKLNAFQQKSLLELYEQIQERLRSFLKQIQQLQSELDTIVFKIYNISEYSSDRIQTYINIFNKNKKPR